MIDGVVERSLDVASRDKLSPAECVVASDLLLELRERLREIEAVYGEEKRRAWERHRELVAAEKEAAGKYTEAYAKLKGMLERAFARAKRQATSGRELTAEMPLPPEITVSERWDGEVTDTLAFIGWLADSETHTPDDWVTFNKARVRQMASAIRDAVAIPGFTTKRRFVIGVRGEKEES